MARKTKIEMVSEILDVMKDYKYTSPKERIINLAAKYHDHEFISDVYSKVENGIVRPEFAMTLLTHIEPVKVETYMY